VPSQTYQFDIASSVEACLAEWTEFQTGAHGTLYQSALWCRAWTETVGRSMAAQTRVVLARTPDGALHLILPLQVRKRQGITVLEWLGSPHHNYGCGLCSAEFLEKGQEWLSLNWDHIVSRIGGIDAVLLTEMPRDILGQPNPMAQFANLPGPNSSFVLRLDSNFAGIYAAKRSSDRRRAARKHETGLSQMGKVSFGLPAGKAELHHVIDVMFRDQSARLAELGIHGVFGPAERQFLHRLADLQDESAPVLAPYRLMLDEQILSVMLGGLHANGYWALISSLSAGPERKYSPGDIALRRTIEACCARGLSFFDFSSGDSAYKRAWADETVVLRICLRGRTPIGFVWSVAMAVRIVCKHIIKTTPLLLKATLWCRRMMFGRKPA
jgi:CelD/BcsL family acetyltransferase involved in cellulose biosynthesis